MRSIYASPLHRLAHDLAVDAVAFADECGDDDDRIYDSLCESSEPLQRLLERTAREEESVGREVFRRVLGEVLDLLSLAREVPRQIDAGAVAEIVYGQWREVRRKWRE